MWNRTAACAATFLIPIVSGCAEPGDFWLPKDASGAPTVNTIVQRVTCELAQVVGDGPGKAAIRNELLGKDYRVLVTLNLSVVQAGSISGSFTGIDPRNSQESVSLTLAPTYEKSREQTFTQNFAFSLKDIRKKLVADPRSLDCPVVGTSEVAGNLGIESTVALALGTNPAYRTIGQVEGLAGGFGGTVTFTVKRSLGPLGPTWALVHLKGTIGLGGTSAENKNKVTFAFAPATKKGGSPSAGAAKVLQQLLDETI